MEIRVWDGVTTQGDAVSDTSEGRVWREEMADGNCVRLFPATSRVEEGSAQQEPVVLCAATGILDKKSPPISLIARGRPLDTTECTDIGLGDDVGEFSATPGTAKEAGGISLGATGIAVMDAGDTTLCEFRETSGVPQ